MTYENNIHSGTVPYTSESIRNSLNEFPSMPGPVRIIVPNEDDHSFHLNEEFLERILLNPKIADKKIAIVGVAGAFRKGKSFLLNFFLRYLKHNNLYKTTDDDGDWLESETNLDGFSWRGGAERDTNGILIWSEPFIIHDRNSEEIAIVLMDTQGAFDSMSTVKDCATIFALSTMISSVQIFNISQNVQEDDLQHLQLFTEYGKLALEGSEGKPFQSLIFVVRDWSYPYDAEYGFGGGQRILDKRLEVTNRQHPELQQLRKHIRDSFETIRCFLMPHPGLEVARSQNFRGQLKDIDPEFQTHLRTLVQHLLDSNNLVIKSINGHAVTCREIVEYFKAYITIFKGEDLPEPKSMLIATAEANNLAAVSSAKALYSKLMEEVCGGDAPYLNTANLEEEHLKCRRDSINQFKTTRKMGGTEFSMKYLDKLDSDITEQYESFVKVNNSKNLFKTMRTPAVLVCVMIIDYILQEFFQLLGIDSIAAIFSSVLLIAILALSIWAYARYSGIILSLWRKYLGNMRDIGQLIDDAVTWLWDNFISQKVTEGVALGMQIHSQLNSTATSGTKKSR